jgi:hypothetical protein
MARAEAAPLANSLSIVARASCEHTLQRIPPIAFSSICATNNWRGCWRTIAAAADRRVVGRTAAHYSLSIS